MSSAASQCSAIAVRVYPGAGVHGNVDPRSAASDCQIGAGAPAAAIIAAYDAMCTIASCRPLPRGEHAPSPPCSRRPRGGRVGPRRAPRLRARRSRPAAPTTSASPPRRPKIGLVLSGGGARGITHIGVLKVLEEAAHPGRLRRRDVDGLDRRRPLRDGHARRPIWSTSSRRSTGRRSSPTRRRAAS